MLCHPLQCGTITRVRFNLRQREKSANLYVLDEHLMREEDRRRTGGERNKTKRKKSVKTDSSYKQVKHFLTFCHSHKTNTLLLVHAGSLFDNTAQARYYRRVTNEQVERNTSETDRQTVRAQDRRKTSERDVTVHSCVDQCGN